MARAGTGTEQTPKRADARGRLVARTALDAINETERLVCGTGAVLRPAIAEGLALEGRPAATLLATGDHGGDCAFTCAPWVHHRLRSGPSSGFAFELTASVSQDAVDHCLVAHELARRIGAPGICTFDPPPAGPLELLRLPHDALVRELTDEPVMDVGSVANEATRAFRRVAGLTGRPLAAVTCDGPQGAEYGLVTGGASRAATRRLALALEAGGLPCRVICIHLIRPFPVFALAEAVSGLAGVLLIPGVDHVVEATRRACIEGGHPQPPVLLDPLDPRDVDDTSAAARLALGLKPARHREASPPVGVPPIVLTARPPGGWAESFLLDLAARLGSIEEVPFRRVGSNLRVGEGDPETGTAAPADLALCAHRSCLDRRSLPAAMARGGTLVIVSRSPVPTDWWNGLRPEVRYEILQRELRLNWLDLGNTPQLELADPAAVRSIVLDGFLAAAAPSLDRVLAREIGSRLAPAALTVLDPTALEAERSAAEADFISPPDSLPTMPPTPSLPNEEASGDADEWRVATRRFHLTGEGAHSAMEPTGAEPLHPLVLEALDLPQRKGASYPMLVFGDPAEEIAEPFERRVAAIFREMASQGEAAAVLPEHLPQLSAAAARVVARGTTPTELGLQVTETLDELRQRFDLSEAAATALRSEGEQLRDRLKSCAPGGTLVGLDAATLPALYAAAVANVRRRRRVQLLEEIDTLVQRLEELLKIDDGHTPQQWTAGEFVDPQKLAANLPRHRGPVRLGESRRLRIERTLTTLRGARDDGGDFDLIVVQPDSGMAGDELPRARVVVHPAGLETAIGLFDGLAAQSVELFRAIRVARLEVDGAYDPSTHDEPLARFDWQALTDDELLSLPRLVVLETDARLHGPALGAFSELLRSGRPLHVLVAQSTSELRATESWQGLAGFHPGMGYVAVAHREAFVVESSLVCPRRLVEDLQKMAGSLRPGVALVAVPAWDAPLPAWIQLQAAQQARAIPVFTYDPEAGSSWADRFDLHGNPQPGRPWPLHTVRYRDADGVEVTLEQAFTFAHGVALDPAYRNHFRILPVEAWGPEQMELADYLAAPTGAVARKLPFIWVVTDDGRLARAGVTRELAYACHDRVRAWRILQELAGTDNEYAHRAAAAARMESRAEAQLAREASDAQHAAEIERVRTETAGEAMDRLARVLMDLDATPPTTRPAAMKTEVPEEPVVEETPEEAEGVVDDEEDDSDVSFNDPYIDSALCTSCRECIDVNSRLFKYDSNKQAFITDPANGTYEELVKSAETCPARCIHPGLPSAGDETVNDGLLARAAKFN